MAAISTNPASCAALASSTVRSDGDERRRAVPRREWLLLRGQRSGECRKRGGRQKRRRAVPRREWLLLRGQRNGESRKRGGASEAPPGRPKARMAPPAGAAQRR